MLVGAVVVGLPVLMSYFHHVWLPVSGRWAGTVYCFLSRKQNECDELEIEKMKTNMQSS
jgi:hypothetical protein